MPNTIRIDCSHYSTNKIGDYWARDLAPHNITNVRGSVDLANYMEYIKVFPFWAHLDGNNVTDFWRRWQLAGFRKKYATNPETHIFSFTDQKLDRQQERELFNSIYESRINKSLLSELRNIKSDLLLLDTYVPQVNNFSQFTGDLMLWDVNHKYSHVYKLAEMIKKID